MSAYVFDHTCKQLKQNSFKTCTTAHCRMGLSIVTKTKYSQGCITPSTITAQGSPFILIANYHNLIFSSPSPITIQERFRRSCKEQVFKKKNKLNPGATTPLKIIGQGSPYINSNNYYAYNVIFLCTRFHPPKDFGGFEETK
jgi:hypothetical protein